MFLKIDNVFKNEIDQKQMCNHFSIVFDIYYFLPLLINNE